MKTLIESLVKALVDFPEQAEIREVDGDRVVVFEIRLNPEDIRKVIGRQGRTIMALRIIMASIAAKAGKRLMLEIIEPDVRAQSASTVPAPAPGIDFGAPTDAPS